MRMSEEDFTSVVDTNLTGSFRVAKRAARACCAPSAGRVVLISSVVGLLGSPGQANYAASKAGLVGFARSLARELGSRSITVQRRRARLRRHRHDRGAHRRLQATDHVADPARPVRPPEEVAASVRFLASDDAAYITGAVIPVDGGLGMGH